MRMRWFAKADSGSDITVKGTVGNVVFDYLRSKDDVSWASSLFVLPTDNEHALQKPTRLTLLSGELGGDSHLAVSREGGSSDANYRQQRRGNQHQDVQDQDHEDDDEDLDDDDDDSDGGGGEAEADAAAAAGIAAAAALAITPFISAELNVSERKSCTVGVKLNAPRLIVAPQVYKVCTSARRRGGCYFVC